MNTMSTSQLFTILIIVISSSHWQELSKEDTSGWGNVTVNAAEMLKISDLINEDLQGLKKFRREIETAIDISTLDTIINNYTNSITDINGILNLKLVSGAQIYTILKRSRRIIEESANIYNMHDFIKLPTTVQSTETDETTTAPTTTPAPTSEPAPPPPEPGRRRRSLEVNRTRRQTIDSTNNVLRKPPLNNTQTILSSIETQMNNIRNEASNQHNSSPIINNAPENECCCEINDDW